MAAIKSACYIVLFILHVTIQHKKHIPFNMLVFILVSKVWREWTGVTLYYYITVLSSLLGIVEGKEPNSKP